MTGKHVTPDRLTVPEKLLLACLEVRKRTATFTAEDLVVEAWRLFPDTFGLSGYATEHPDSNRVLTNIMGTKGMRGKGWLRKVGEKQYRLTSAGLNDGEALLLRDQAADNSKAVSYLRAELDRQTASALERLLLTTAARKADEHQEDAISFLDACGFWDITVRSNANTLNARLADTAVVLERAVDAIVRNGDTGGLKVGSGEVSKPRVETLVRLHSSLQTRFKEEIDIIRRRTDERIEKRARLS